jgi:hypothetical protein
MSTSNLPGGKAVPALKAENLTAICEPIATLEAFMAVTMKNAVFWDVTPCGSCKNRRLEGTYRLHHQGENN